jgi:hypothetical protein
LGACGYGIAQTLRHKYNDVIVDGSFEGSDGSALGEDANVAGTDGRILHANRKYRALTRALAQV